MNKNKKDMPLSMLIETAKSEYSEKINKITKKYQLSYYVLWLIFKDFLYEIEKQKETELIQTIEEYNKQEKGE